MRPQLLEKHVWGEFKELPFAGKSIPVSWPIPSSESVDEGAASLARFIERDVVPGLIIAHRTPQAKAQDLDSLAVDTIEEFTELVLAEEPPVLCAFIEDLHLNGATFEALYLGLLAGTAKRLGEYWETDRVDFTSVTIGLWRLQQVLRSFSPVFQIEGAKPANGHRALLLSTPGEQHNFGLAMLGEFLFRDGWSVAGGPGLKTSEVSDLVHSQSFSIVGLSLSSEDRMDSLISIIRLIRRASRNLNIAVMVGGPLFVRRPELVATVGADATAPDARQGAARAELLVANLSRPF